VKSKLDEKYEKALIDSMINGKGQFHIGVEDLDAGGSFITESVKKLNEGLYGPRYCQKCDKVQPVHTYEKMGTHFTKMEGTTLTEGFVGAHVCTVCHTTIGSEDSDKKSQGDLKSK